MILPELKKIVEQKDLTDEKKLMMIKDLIIDYTTTYLEFNKKEVKDEKV